MPADTTRILILGDIIGQPGLRAVVSALKTLTRKYRSDVVIVNGENADQGFGINAEIAGRLFKAGADVITTGNHVWHDDAIADLLNREPFLLRPANYPGGAPGSGFCTVDRRTPAVSVINLQGRVRMPSIDCPFRAARDLVKRAREKSPIIIVDFHAESTEEKEALAFYLDGDVSVFFGTHTHVQTADERILPRKTAYITDIGACLPRNSVIGFDSTISVRRSLTQIPIRNEVATDAATIHGLIATVENSTGDALSIERIQYQSLV